MPQLDKRPAYQRIADHYRNRILAGELQPGQMLPSVTELMAEWGVSRDTAHKAMGQLIVAKLAWASSRGTFVADNRRNTTSPQDRARLIASPASETVEVTAAETVVPPPYVSETLGVMPGELVIRREEVASRRGVPVRLTVDWIPAVGGQITCAHLLDRVVVEGGVIGCLERATGRKVVHGYDSLESRVSDAREAVRLDLPLGGPVLAVVTEFSDGEGVLLYQESAVPPRMVFGYEYALGDDEPTA